MSNHNEGGAMDAYKVLLGEILIQRNRITRRQLEVALAMQRQDRCSAIAISAGPVLWNENNFIGEILVKLGYLNEKDIVAALGLQLGLPYIAVNKYDIDPQIVRLIPFEVAQKEKVIALDRIGDILSVVMSRPLTEAKKRLLESLTQCSIATFISTKTEIEQAIACKY